MVICRFKMVPIDGHSSLVFRRLKMVIFRFKMAVYSL